MTPRARRPLRSLLLRMPRPRSRGGAPGRRPHDLTEPGPGTAPPTALGPVLGHLLPELAHPGTTDLLVTGDGRVWVDRGDGVRVAPSRTHLAGAASVHDLAVRLAHVAGCRLDPAHPWLDATLAGGLRVHAVLQPPAVDGPQISIRVLRRADARIDTWVATGGLPRRWADLLVALVHRGHGFLVTGATGSGKTTLLAALLAEAPAHERIVLVEDVAELSPCHPHVVRLQARPANVEGAGGIDLADLVRAALRMRPDRIVVGECRGAEIRELLAAVNTGHRGGCATLHANGAREVPARLLALGLAAGLDATAVALQAAAGLAVVVHVARGPDGRRAVDHVGLLDRHRDGTLTVDPALTRDRHGRPRTPAGAAWERLDRMLAHPGLVP